MPSHKTLAPWAEREADPAPSDTAPANQPPSNSDAAWKSWHGKPCAWCEKPVTDAPTIFHCVAAICVAPSPDNNSFRVRLEPAPSRLEEASVRCCLEWS